MRQIRPSMAKPSITTKLMARLIVVATSMPRHDGSCSRPNNSVPKKPASTGAPKNSAAPYSPKTPTDSARAPRVIAAPPAPPANDATVKDSCWRAAVVRSTSTDPSARRVASGREGSTTQAAKNTRLANGKKKRAASQVGAAASRSRRTVSHKPAAMNGSAAPHMASQ